MTGEDWPHQLRGIQGVVDAGNAGHMRPVIASPTGGGKSRIIMRFLESIDICAVYANRKMLLEQLSRGCTEAGIAHGMMAAGYPEETQHGIQLCSTQTVDQRVRDGRWNIHPAKLVFIDEAHNERGDRMKSIIQAHREQGAMVCGVTATPVGLSGIYDHLIQAGTTSELRACGALLPAYTYAPDEIDAKCYKSNTTGVLQFRDEVRETLLAVVFGRVIEHYKKLNPDRRPAILFAPGVQESLWFAEQFERAGIESAHIDGERIWIRGEVLTNNAGNRDKLREVSESGEVKIVCNRFVMREGIDWRHLYHGIFACTFGGICGYLQSGGRILRNHPSMDHVIIQDHGGNYWRHGSLNADREWSLEDTEQSIAAERMHQMREKAEPEPVPCPECGKVNPPSPVCRACGFSYRGKQRFVIQTDGELRLVRGDIVQPRKKSDRPEDHKAWLSCYYRCKNSGKTFSQAAALFARENGGRWPGDDFPKMPAKKSYWQRRIKDFD